MKTPREVLFGRHRAAEEKLDAIRRQVTANIRARGLEKAESLQPRPMRLALNVWRELVCPSRMAWGALALIWITMLALNFGESGSRSARHMRAGENAGAFVVRNWQEQQRLLAELLEPPPPKPADPLRPKASGRRGESRPIFKTC